jgi:hypothetical protein
VPVAHVLRYRLYSTVVESETTDSDSELPHVTCHQKIQCQWLTFAGIGRTAQSWNPRRRILTQNCHLALNYQLPMVPSSELELEVTGGSALVDITAGDVQINKLGSTSSDLEGRNPATTPKLKTKIKKKQYSFDVLSNKEHQFYATLQLLQLVVALIAHWVKKPEGEHCNKKPSTSSETRKAFDYVDAITNLMVRNGEVVAAVSCGGVPSGGLISFHSPSETPSSENAQVHPQYTSYVSC